MKKYGSLPVQCKPGHGDSQGFAAKLTLIVMRKGNFHPLVLFGADFVSWFFIANFQTFLDVKIDINRVNLTPCQAQWVWYNLLLGGAKDKHFSSCLSSCQLGLNIWTFHKFVRKWFRIRNENQEFCIGKIEIIDSKRSYIEISSTFLHFLTIKETVL